MKKTRLTLTLLAGALAGATTLATAAPFGEPSDVDYAKQLWAALDTYHLQGEYQVNTVPYTGQHPHGAILETVESVIQVGDDVGLAIVKRNYGGEGVSSADVMANRGAFLKAVTVMFKRRGFDPDNQNWFWAKYLPDGSLDKNPKGMMLAGKVAKGADKGCIACHQAAPGGDYVFNH